MIDFTSIQRMLEDTKTGGLPLWQNIMVSDCARQGIDRTLSWRQMERLLDAMEQADRDYRDTDRSVSGLVGGDGGRMARYGDGADTLCGPFLSEVMAGALRMGECNACMKRIVAAPTAGSCGVLPAVLLPCGRRFGLPREQMIRALYVSAGFGMVIANRASISGAEGGCQAEVGVACSMAAAAACQAFGYNIHQIEYAAEVSLEHHLGLTCDPICGLVQVPCIERNAVAAMRAINSANIAYFLTGTRNISYDMVLKSMYYTGLDMNQRYRETAEGGLARIYTRRGK